MGTVYDVWKLNGGMSYMTYKEWCWRWFKWWLWCRFHWQTATPEWIKKLEKAPIYVKERGNLYIFADDLAKTDKFWEQIEKFQDMSQRLNLKKGAI